MGLLLQAFVLNCFWEITENGALKQRKLVSLVAGVPLLVTMGKNPTTLRGINKEAR